MLKIRLHSGLASGKFSIVYQALSLGAPLRQNWFEIGWRGDLNASSQCGKKGDIF